MRWRDRHGTLRPIDDVFREHLVVVKKRLSRRVNERLNRRRENAVEPCVIIRGSVGAGTGEHEVHLPGRNPLAW